MSRCMMPAGGGANWERLGRLPDGKQVWAGCARAQQPQHYGCTCAFSLCTMRSNAGHTSKRSCHSGKLRCAEYKHGRSRRGWTTAPLSSSSTSTCSVTGRQASQHLLHQTLDVPLMQPAVLLPNQGSQIHAAVLLDEDHGAPLRMCQGGPGEGAPDQEIRS